MSNWKKPQAMHPMSGVRAGREGAPFGAMGGFYGRPPEQEPAAYERFSASQLYCPKCRQAMPVKENLLLYIPGGEMYDYVCARCGTSVGSRKTG